MTTKTITNSPLSVEELRKTNAYWRAANYLSVGQIYLHGNPLLREPLRIEHVKRRLLGHWGTTPGLNFLYDPAALFAFSGHRVAGARPGWTLQPAPLPPVGPLTRFAALF
jgi:phosphoketolase